MYSLFDFQIVIYFFVSIFLNMKNILIIRCIYCILTMGMSLSVIAADFSSTISATHGCDCTNADNQQANGTYYFAEKASISGDMGDTWLVDMNYSVGMIDASGAPMTAPLTFTETASGVYELDFWHKKDAGYRIHAYNSAGEYLALNSVCYDYCESSCTLYDGLVIIDCVSDRMFTFSLNPSGAGFSGTYNLSGDVNAYGVTGTFTSGPTPSDEGDINITVSDVNNPSCGLTFNIPPPACSSLTPTIAASNSCDCSNSDNYLINGDYYYAENVGILFPVTGDTWLIDMNYSVGLLDDSGSPLSSPLSFTETSPGIYEFNFWHKKGAGYGIHAYNSEGEYVSLNNVCMDTCPSICSINNDGLIINDCLPNDRFTFSLNPSGTNFSGMYNLSGDVVANNVTGVYTSPPTASDEGNINVTITDINDPACTMVLDIPPPACASPTCSIDDFGLTIGSCTPADRFVFTLDPSGIGFSGTYHLRGDVHVNNITGVYTSPAAFTNVGDINITIIDAANPACKATVYITPPNCNETCSVDDFGLVINGCTASDRFTFSLTPSGTNFSGTYNLSGDIVATGVTGTYTSPPALTTVGLINVLVTDAADPSCRNTLYVTPPTCPQGCNISNDGLLINGCTGDDKFTFSLDPSGLGFSGKYNLSGDVAATGLTGIYTSPPAMTTVGDINVTITDAADLTCKMTVFIPPPACSVLEPSIHVGNGCDCNNSNNYEKDGTYYFAETVAIIGPPGDTWLVNINYSTGMRDASGVPMTAPLMLTETTPGLYELSFWHAKNAGYGIHTYNKAGEYLSINDVCMSHCNSSCTMYDGLVIIDCVSDKMFTYSLDPAGSGFSGTYNLSGDVTAYGITGAFTSEPTPSDEGNINIIITDANDASCGLNVDIPPPACSVLTPSISASNSCDCSNSNNYDANGTYYYEETLGIFGPPNETWMVDFNFSVGLTDDSGTPMSSPMGFKEVSSGLYVLTFWHRMGAGYGIHAYNSAGDYVSLNNMCMTACPSACTIDNDGLIINECTLDDRFIFSLNPSGSHFSGTYNLSGDVAATNVTGAYTSPPALTNVGDINVTITDANNPSCKMTVYIPPPACSNLSTPVLAIENGCACPNSGNYDSNGAHYFAENASIIGPVGDTWTVDMDYSAGLMDASGAPMSGTMTFKETSPGLYEFSFWHRLSAGYALHVYNSSGQYISLNDVCHEPCSAAANLRVSPSVDEVTIAKIFPNPVKDNVLNVHFNSDATHQATILITDILGKNQMRVPVNANEGTNFVSINTNELTMGSYMIMIKGNNWTSKPSRFVKAK